MEEFRGAHLVRSALCTSFEVDASIPASAFDGAEARTITVKAGPRELTFAAPHYLASYAIPNFYFHMSTAYSILRANGVEVGKGDFLGG